MFLIVSVAKTSGSCCVVNMFLVQIEAQESIVQNVAGLKNWWFKQLLVYICSIQRVAL